MTHTREQLATRALNKLGVVGAGQTAAAEDLAVVDDSLDSIMSDLATRGVWVWGDPDAIDDDAFEHLAVILANANATEFGEPEDEQKRLMAEARLRQLQVTFLSGQPLAVDYY